MMTVCLTFSWFLFLYVHLQIFFCTLLSIWMKQKTLAYANLLSYKCEIIKLVINFTAHIDWKKSTFCFYCPITKLMQEPQRHVWFLNMVGFEHQSKEIRFFFHFLSRFKLIYSKTDQNKQRSLENTKNVHNEWSTYIYIVITNTK